MKEKKKKKMQTKESYTNNPFLIARIVIKEAQRFSMSYLRSVYSPKAKELKLFAQHKTLNNIFITQQQP